jgi:RNA-directed DNA polymerase
MLNSLRGRRKLIDLWYEQNRRCPIRQYLITKETGWHVHHIARRADGGKDGSINLVMVHPNCHNKIHAEGLEAVKPARENGL